ncbi:MFS polyamine transporter [Coniophora puteana RWD-64-598 SS2]|uniref:MFS polyamine transporter n=1 Tax=Coniophora puteana (strain RWD-64-598) TaxID=741705 RepID=A0A5M3N2H0_CONPW|nr:MFS polyamine transporter [Coniophora puteana RWD-64-598 SS2]EIW85582.1 MFS polyamine transporter [Coniophora puteana RWD-64-598 SS2]
MRTPRVSLSDVKSPKGPADSVPDTADEATPDALVVDWDGPDDPQNPKNWSFKRKWVVTAIASAFTFITPVGSSMIAPASPQVAHDFGVTSDVVMALDTSIFILAFAVGPLFIGPLSEIFGRSRVLQLSNLWFLAWNLGSSFAQSQTQLLVFRFLSGLGGGAPLSIGGGVIGDVWRAEERGTAMALYGLAPILGPVVGPLTGSWVAQYSNWRWVFWSLSIADVFVVILGFFFLQETYAVVLLERKAKRIRASMDPEKSQHRVVRTIFDKQGERSWKSIFKQSMFRPFVLFWYEPIVQALGIYMAYLYGILYLCLTTMPTIYQDIYHMKLGPAGLNYIALGIGLSGASQLNSRTMDRIYAYLKRKNGTEGKPEYRLPSMAIGTVMLPIGLLITGWTTQAQVHWIAPDIGIAIVGAGVILNFQCIQTYVVDTFTLHAASALAMVNCLRSIAGFGFPLFAPTMYQALGYGKGDTILAAAAVVIGGPAPLIFWFYGEKIRLASRYGK